MLLLLQIVLLLRIADGLPKKSRHDTGNEDLDKNAGNNEPVMLLMGVPLTADKIEEKLNVPLNSIWPNGKVNYLIKNPTNGGTSIKILTRRLVMVFKDISKYSCLEFSPIHEPPENGQFSWLYITFASTPNKPCNHHIKQEGFKIILEIGYSCLKKHKIMHVVMHALGFDDEVTRKDRDQFVRVHWDNILPEYKKLFNINKKTETRLPYDQESIMHFSEYELTKNGQATISHKSPIRYGNTKKELSMMDIKKLEVMFGHECNNRKVVKLMQSCHNAMHEEEEQRHPELFTKPDLKLADCKNAESSSEVVAKLSATKRPAYANMPRLRSKPEPQPKPYIQAVTTRKPVDNKYDNEIEKSTPADIDKEIEEILKYR